MERIEAQKYKGMIFAIIGGIFWGLAGVFGQYLFVNHGLNAKWLVSVRLLLAGVMLLIPVMIKEKKQVFAIWKDKKNIPTIFLFAIFGMGLCQLAYYTAVQFSNAGTATVIQYTGPAMIMVYFCIRYRRKPQFMQVLALIMAMAGVFLLATKGDVTSLNISPTALVWGILSAIALAAYNLIPVNLMAKYGTLSVIGWGMLLAGIMMAAYVRPWHIIGTWDWKAVGALAVVVIVGTILSFAFYMEGVRLTGAQTASLIASVEPVTATVATVLMMGVAFTMPEVIGIVIIIIAVIILSLKSD